MYIGGVRLEKTLKKTKPLQEKSRIQDKFAYSQPKHNFAEQRPYSSELRLLQIKKNYSIGVKETLKSKERKNLSRNKLTIKKVEEKDSQRENSVEKDANNQRNSKKQINENKKPVKSAKKNTVARVPSVKGINLFSEQELFKIQVFFRYHPISILALAGCKQDFLIQLTNNQDFSPIKAYKKPSQRIDISMIITKLIKNAQLKGKYRLRQRFNFTTSPQLKAINYKKKEIKKKKDESSSSEDEKKQKCRDMATWKKVMGVEGKVFIIKGKYPDLRNALLARGWTENEDKKSTFYDLRWTTKISDINFNILKPNQMVNHFNNNACLTSKYGIIKSLRSIVFTESIDIDKFFPKAFDMSDLGDFQNFLEVYKWNYCESILKRFVKSTEQEPSSLPLQKIKLALIILQRRLMPMTAVIPQFIDKKYNFCSPSQWKYLTTKNQTKQADSPVKERGKTMKTAIDKISTSNVEQLKQLASLVLDELRYGNGSGFYEPQYNLNGDKNIWIVKPSFLSRGRGIKCLTGLSEILDNSLGKETQYVVQKYIENPLIINNRKFDIRIWVLVQDYCPPRIWFYNPFYVRFCLQSYNPAQLKNRYAHLTNNSVQKYNKKFTEEERVNDSMWDRKTFQAFIQENYSTKAFNKIISQMKQIIVATILGTTDQVAGRVGSFEMIGYDMMIDDNLNTWLIEINSSPAMDYSTVITRKLVACVMEDIAKVIVDLRGRRNISKGQTAGDFKCIYSGGDFKVKNYPIGATEKQSMKNIEQKEQLSPVGQSKQIRKEI